MSEQGKTDQDEAVEDGDPALSEGAPGDLFRIFGYLFLVAGLLLALALALEGLSTLERGQSPPMELLLPAIDAALYSVLIFLPLEGLARIINLLAEIRDSGMR